MPKVGDISVCFYCGELMQFGIGLVLEKADEVDFFLNGPPHIVRFVQKAQTVIKSLNKLKAATRGIRDDKFE